MVLGPAASAKWPEFAQELGLNMRRARHAKNLTQEQMAELVGISLYAYQQYERGAVTKDGTATNPRLATLLAICQALDVTIDEVLPLVPRLLAPR